MTLHSSGTRGTRSTERSVGFTRRVNGPSRKGPSEEQRGSEVSHFAPCITGVVPLKNRWLPQEEPDDCEAIALLSDRVAGEARRYLEKPRKTLE
ncbi:unnamed protein product [Sphagnum tenellum]